QRPFAPGDVLVGGDLGVNQYDKDLNLIAFYDPQQGPPYTGMAFDARANLFTTNYGSQTITKIDFAGNLVAPNPFATADPGNYGFDPESILFDAAGNIYVG